MMLWLLLIKYTFLIFLYFNGAISKKKTRMISVPFQGKPFNIIVTQVYVP